MGGGGSILGIPVFVYLMVCEVDQATTYSWFIIGVASMIGTMAYLRKGNISMEAILQFGLPSLITVFFIRKYVMPNIPEIINLFGFDVSKHVLIMAMFSILIIASSLNLIKKKKQDRINKTKWDEFCRSPLGLPFIIVLGVAFGFVIGFLGAGGGFIIVPVLMQFLNLEFKKAVGTSLCIISLNSLVGFIGSIGHVAIDWNVLSIVTISCILGLVLGNTLSNKISSHILKPAFGWFTLVVGFFIFVKEILL